jgi:hypothetical protein
MASSVANSAVRYPSEDSLALVLECSSLKDLASLSQVNHHFHTVVDNYAFHVLARICSSYDVWIKMQPGKINAFKTRPESSSLEVIYCMYKLLIRQKGRIMQMAPSGKLVVKVEKPLDFPLCFEVFQNVYNENRDHRAEGYLKMIHFQLGLDSQLFNQLMEKYKGDQEKFLKRSFIYFDLPLLLKRATPLNSSNRSPLAGDSSGKSGVVEGALDEIKRAALKIALFTNYWEPISVLVKAGIRCPDFLKLKETAINRKAVGLEWIQAYEFSVNKEERFSCYKEILTCDLGEKRVNRALRSAEGNKFAFTSHLLEKKINPSLLLEASVTADYWEPVSRLVEAGARLLPAVEGEPQTLTQKWTGSYKRAVKKAERSALCSID